MDHFLKNSLMSIKFGSLAITVILLFALLPSLAFGWQKVREKDGIQVFQKPIAGTTLVAFKGEGIIEESLLRVASVLFDVARSPEWSKSIGESRILKWLDPRTYIEYDHVKTPIIIKDRDFVTRVRLDYNKDEAKMIFEYQSVEDESAPKTRYVRGHVISASYVLRAIDATRTYLVGELSGDPKGSLPSWIVNYYQRDWPIETIQNLRAQVKKSDIQDSPVIKAVLEGTLQP